MFVPRGNTTLVERHNPHPFQDEAWGQAISIPDDPHTHIENATTISYVSLGGNPTIAQALQ